MKQAFIKIDIFYYIKKLYIKILYINISII